MYRAINTHTNVNTLCLYVTLDIHCCFMVFLRLGNGKNDMAPEAVKVDLECPQGGSIKGLVGGGTQAYIWFTSGKLCSFESNFMQLGNDFYLEAYKETKVNRVCFSIF